MEMDNLPKPIEYLNLIFHNYSKSSYDFSYKHKHLSPLLDSVYSMKLNQNRLNSKETMKS